MGWQRGDINRVSDRTGSAGSKAKSRRWAWGQIPRLKWAKGPEGSFAPGCVTWRAGRLAQQEEVGCKGKQGKYFLTCGRWRREVTEAGVVRKAGPHQVQKGSALRAMCKSEALS